jgi:hypothetical protein
MDTGFLSSSEAPKASESQPVVAPPELTPSFSTPTPEQAGFIETKLETETAQTRALAEITAHDPVADTQLAAVPVAPTIAVAPDQVVVDVQKILEDGLEEAIVTMPEEAKQRFLQKGKEIGTIVADMVRRYKVEVKRVLHLLKDWLTTIPGVNRFFLEKEAKIKTDRILELERVRHAAAPV